MRSHLWLPSIVALCATISVAQLDVNLSLANDPRFNKMLPNSKPGEEEIKPDVNRTLANDPMFNKMLPKDPEIVKVDDDKFKPDPNIPMAQDPRFNKMLPEIVTPKAEDKPKTETKIPLADDPRFNKMLQSTVEPAIITTSKTGSKEEITTGTSPSANHFVSDEMDDDEYDDYYEYNNYVDDDNETMNQTTISKKETEELKPIKTNVTAEIEEVKQNIINNDNSYEDDNDDDEEDDIVFNENVPCPQDCVCNKNINEYLVATCNRLDEKKQKFGSNITDLEIINVPSHLPIRLSAGFFKKIGLKRVSSIKITHSKVEYIDPNAFEGLTELYSVNLTDSGLMMIDPDTFKDNKKLRLLSLSGNDLSVMQRPIVSPYSDYMLNSGSLEELDISDCNFQQLLPTAFNKLRNIVFINLHGNKLRTLPAGIFDKVETIEELDLSANLIENLPKFIFNRTSLSILNLRNNEITSKLDFVTSDLQKLDLSYNKMTYINNLMFKDTTGLTGLILKGNSIRRVHQAAFYSLKELRNIDVSYNDLEQISALIFLGNKELDVVRINDNPRLKKLPLDGFESDNKVFNIYYFDASNCDISDLGDNTFRTMPHLTTLNLSWNNIENLGKSVFSYLSKLIDLDLSNNLLTELSDYIFFHNKNLRKLNLAGNPLQKLASKVFLPTKQITELDLSDCDLEAIWSDFSASPSNMIFKNLKIFNISNNEIAHIHQNELEVMKSLTVLDIDNNKLQCDVEFKTLIQWLGKRKIKAGNLHRDIYDNAELNEDAFLIEGKNEDTWDDLARDVCKRDAESFKGSDDIIDTDGDSSIDDEDDDDDDEEDETSKIADDINERGDDNLIYDDDEYDSDEEDMKVTPVKKLTDDELLAEEVNIIKGIGDKIIDLEDDDEIILKRRPFIYYGQYRYLMPILIIVFSVLAILLLIGKIVSILMRRRGERYRQALLASKNSIVYQKLSEDICGPTTPKFHRYAPINQV